LILTGNHAVSYGVRAAKAEVVAAYPITPQTQIIEKLEEFIASGIMKAKYVTVESEHSAMTACISAESCGARSFTATSSHGLAYMSEMVFWAGLGRFPLTMAVVNRTLGPPWNIWDDHTDILTHRDSGWVIMMCSSAQEAYDTAIQAYRIAEDEKVLQPVMYGLDAFSLSHTAENVDFLDQNLVDSYLPALDPSKLPVLMDPESPATFGNLVGPDRTMELRNRIRLALRNSKQVIEEAAREFEEISGRRQTGLIEDYMCSDAEVILVAAGASCGDAKDAIDLARSEGVRAGLVRLKAIRPFPDRELTEKAGRAKAVAVVDRDYSFGFGGILYGEVASFLRKPVQSFIAGLGGRDLTVEDFRGMIDSTISKADKGDNDLEEVWWDLKEEAL
jgi:pyruvate ferredoxin oxidoreductase alpha subunit